MFYLCHSEQQNIQQVNGAFNEESLLVVVLFVCRVSYHRMRPHSPVMFQFIQLYTASLSFDPKFHFV